jgi:hypothetical protein
MHRQLVSEARRSAAPSGAASELQAAYDRAAAAGDEATLEVEVAGGRVTVRAAEEALLDRLGPALAHLEVEGGDAAELTIHAWDSVSAADATPPLPATEPGPRGAVVYSADDGFQIAYQPGLGQLSAFDAGSGRGWFWCRDRDALPFWEPAAPFRQVLHWWFAERDVMLLHGAAVGTAEGGVLLVGRGGSGKSTCALASLDSDLLYAGDDYVAVALGESPRVHSVYGSGKLVPDHSRRLPHLPSPVFAGDGEADEKSIFFVNTAFPERMCSSFPLRAVVAPHVAPGEAVFERVGAAVALRALAPSTLLQLYPARPEALTRMAGLLRTVPAYTLATGEDIGAIPAAIARLLEELAP